MVFADPGLVIAQPIEQFDQFHVARQRLRWVFVEGVKRRQENAAPKVSVCHGSTSLRASIVAVSRIAQNHPRDVVQSLRGTIVMCPLRSNRASSTLSRSGTWAWWAASKRS